MIFTWVDFCEKYEDEIKAWCQDELSLRYATNESDGIKEDYEYWRNEDGFIHNENCFCKVVLDGGQPVAVLIMLAGDGYPVNINPIIVNPALRNKGYCTRIIRELLDNTQGILGVERKYFEAGIDIENTASIHAFEKAGFVLAGKYKSGDFAYWIYPASELENYRKYCIDSMGDDFIAVSTLSLDSATKQRDCNSTGGLKGFGKGG